jgi:hypothetical protein
MLFGSRGRRAEDRRLVSADPDALRRHRHGRSSAAATAARATVYGVLLDGAILGLDASQSQRSPTLMEDRALSRHGLEWWQARHGAPSSRRPETRRTRSSGLPARSLPTTCSVPTRAADRDGRTHKIKVSVARPE